MASAMRKCSRCIPRKLLNASEGGYVTTNNNALADRLDKIKRFGLQHGDTITDCMALNAKFNEVHAAEGSIGIARRDLWEQIAQHRRKYELLLHGPAKHRRV